MTRNLNDVTTLDEFMLWFGEWCADGDFIEVLVNDDTEEKTIYAYNGCAFCVAEFSTTKGLTTYK